VVVTDYYAAVEDKSKAILRALSKFNTTMEVDRAGGAETFCARKNGETFGSQDCGFVKAYDENQVTICRAPIPFTQDMHSVCRKPDRFAKRRICLRVVSYELWTPLTSISQAPLIS
jgi:hypothetical protein